MSNIAVLKINSCEYEEEFLRCKYMKGYENILRTFFESVGISSYKDITDLDQQRYVEYIDVSDMKETKKRTAKAAMENFVYEALLFYEPELVQEMQRGVTKDAMTRKAVSYLIRKGVKHQNDITYKDREKYEEYIQQFIGKKKQGEYLKRFDEIKLNGIKTDSIKRTNSFIPYKNEKVFLYYYPDYEIAKSFHFSQDKKKLVFDFTKPGSICLKKQIWMVLQKIIENYQLTGEKEKDLKIRHSRYESGIKPLYYFYDWCLRKNILNVMKITQSNKDQYKMELQTAGLMNSHYKILGISRRIVFSQLSAEEKWESDIWYLREFNIEESRMNKSNYIDYFQFDNIKEEENKAIIKAYIRNRIVNSTKSLQRIRQLLHNNKRFILFVETQNEEVTSITEKSMKRYISLMDNGIEPETFNQVISSIYDFYCFLYRYSYIDSIPFDIKEVWKKTYEKHLNRSVEKEVITSILNSLSGFPEVERLIYVHLWSTGLRLNEICTLKAGNYSLRGDTAWLRVWQNKLKTEKDIPIPKTLYLLMMKYIDKNRLNTNEYVFGARDKMPYRTATFRDRFKRSLKELNVDVGDYHFRAHDLRHNVATCIFKNTNEIQVSRQFLGHKDQKMTKRYVDYVDREVAKKNSKYLENNSIWKRRDKING